MRASHRDKPRDIRCGGLLFSTDKKRIDLDVVYLFLSKSYWAKGIPRETVARSIRNSLCFGVYKRGKQVGFARVISDYATYAYIGDVFVVEAYRGEGVGQRLMKWIMEHPNLQGLRRWSLVTRDAHGLYSRFGFTPLKSPERHMEIHNANVYNSGGDSAGSQNRLADQQGKRR
jgi:N-acetylglutamate synthase-like GNAT family acetyltransferase